MREILERHAARLGPDERRATWEAVVGMRSRASRARSRWTLPAAATVAAGVASLVFVFAVLQRQPAGLRLGSAATPGERPSTAEAPSPVRDRVRPETPPVGIAAPTGIVPMPTPDAVTPEASATLRAPSASMPAAPAGAGVVTGRVTDSRNQPVPYANVIVLGTRLGALTGEDGSYRIAGLPPATYAVKVIALGHASGLREGVLVEGDQPAIADVQLGEQRVVKQLDEIQVRALKRLETKSSTSKQSISAEKLRGLPVDNLGQVAGGSTGKSRQGDAPVFRGGRGGEVRFQIDGATRAVPPPVIPTTGGTRLPNDEAFDSMFFRNHGVNPFIATDEDALSTFALDVDAASYTLARRYLELGQLPPADAIRVEEFVNFFPQGYPRFEREDFRILLEGAPSPFGSGYHLLRIGLKGREIAQRDRKPAQLTFVIDVSGSMSREDRLELAKRALRLLVDELDPDDRVGIVVYGTRGRVILEPVALGSRAVHASRGRRDSREADDDEPQAWEAGRRRILEAIGQLRPEGSTNAEEGLRLGYDMARRGFRPQAINRIVLCSDGVANVGLTGPESILAQVRGEADRGIHLTTIGFGMGNYNDVLMEQLADRGDGNHYYVDDLDEARRVLVENLTGTLQTIANDAKVQVEFDSTRVLRYRLLGFENRDVADRDFRNDRVDAGEVGAGHEVTALYEVKLAPGVSHGTLATVRLRYARPEQETAGAPRVLEIERRFDVAGLGRRFEDAAPRFRLDAAVAEFAEILRGSYWAREGRLSDVLSVARSAAGSLRDEKADEFVTLVEKAAALSARSKPEQGGE